MVLYIQDSGLQVSEMATDRKCGQMVLDMKVVGNMIKQMVWGSWSMPMVTYMKVNG